MLCFQSYFNQVSNEYAKSSGRMKNPVARQREKRFKVVHKLCIGKMSSLKKENRIFYGRQEREYAEHCIMESV